MKIAGPWTISLIDKGPQYQWLDGGRRLHLQHGPIDLVIEAVGEPEEMAKAYKQAHETFQAVLTGLVAELDYLRCPLTENSMAPEGLVARRMYHAALKYMRLDRITPMVAVAGSVADHVLQAMLRSSSLVRAYVNNGGDIALWLAPDESFTVGVCENPDTGHMGAHVCINAQDEVRGIATSGWRGRSHSLGIADAVTVLAASAADADTAATLIANAVDVPGSPLIHREPACNLSPESDLGDRLVTVAVDTLAASDVAHALDGGRSVAERLISMQGLSAAYISLMGSTIVCERNSTKQTLRAGAMHA
ncbi:MAG: UPF0280 family protein [Granulosicoccus sp.]